MNLQRIKDEVYYYVYSIYYDWYQYYYDFKLKYTENNPKKHTHLNILRKQRQVIIKHIKLMDSYHDKYDVENWREFI